MQPNVKSFMTGSPLSIEPDASALAALDLMVEHGIRHLPVVDGARRVCGVLSFDDLRAALPVPLSLHRGLSVDERNRVADEAVGEIMTYSAMVLRREDSLEQAVSTMLANRLSCLPVVDEQGRLDGILTETDLLEALATVLWSERKVEPALPSASEDLVALLEKEAAHLKHQLETYEDEEQSFATLRREVPLDVVEVGSHAGSAQLEGQIAEMAAQRLRAIEEALMRADEGTLEVCQGCGGRISEARLRALPGAQLCIGCAREAERIG